MSIMIMRQFRHVILLSVICSFIVSKGASLHVSGKQNQSFLAIRTNRNNRNKNNPMQKHAAVLSRRGGGGFNGLRGLQTRQKKNKTSTELSMTEGVHAAAATSVKNKARLLLILVAFLYGTLNVVFRLLYAMPNPPSASTLGFTRGWLAAASFIPIVLTQPKKTQPSNQSESTDPNKAPLWRAALELAFWNFGAQGLLNVGLLFTDAARASFLTQTSVVITPIISILAGHKVPKIVWAGCTAALAGLVMLSGAVGGAGAAFAFSTGDLLVMGGALSWSMYLFRIASVGKRYPEIPLQSVKTTLLAVLYSVWFASSAIKTWMEGASIVNLWLGWKNLAAWGMLLYSGFGPGALADVLQQKGQKEVSASEANVILSSEPIFTAICARLVLGEITSQTENIGGGLIILGALLASGGA